MLSAMPQGRDGQASTGSDCGFTTQQRRSPIAHVKPCVPLETIKEERGLTTKTWPYTQRTIKAIITFHSQRVFTQSS